MTPDDITPDDITPELVINIMTDPQCNTEVARHFARLVMNPEVLDAIGETCLYIQDRKPSCYERGHCFCQMCAMFSIGLSCGVAIAQAVQDQKTLARLVQ